MQLIQDILAPKLTCFSTRLHYYLKQEWQDFPGGLVVKNPPSKARDAGSIPGQGTKIPHA